jgi:hypothetical protein
VTDRADRLSYMFFGALGMLIALGIFSCGLYEGGSMNAEQCTKLGAFEQGGKIYDCKERRP